MSLEIYALRPRGVRAILLRMRLLALTVLLSLLTNFRAVSQTPAPPTTAPVPMELSERVIADMPPDWVRTPEFVRRNGFLEHTGSSLVSTFFRQGARPTDLPYLTLEYFRQNRNPTQAEQEEAAEIVRSYYLTAIRPPSKADRAAGWKRATVTPIVYDFVKGTFNFHATIYFDSGGDYQVDVSGIYDQDNTVVLSAWSDASSKADAPVLAAILDSVRYRVPVAPTLSFQEQLVHLAKIAGVLLILLVVGIQLYVFVRERQQRRGDALAVERMLE